MSGAPPVVQEDDATSRESLADRVSKIFYPIVPTTAVQTAISDGAPLTRDRSHRIAVSFSLGLLFGGRMGSLNRAKMDPKACAIVALINKLIDAAGDAPVFLEELLNYNVLDGDGQPVDCATKAFRLWVIMNDEEFNAFNEHVAEGCSPDVTRNSSYVTRNKNGTRFLVSPGKFCCDAKAICSKDRLVLALAALMAGQDSRWDQGITFDPNIGGAPDDDLLADTLGGSAVSDMNVDDLFSSDGQTDGTPDRQYYMSAFYNPKWDTAFDREQLSNWGVCEAQSDPASYFTADAPGEFTAPNLHVIKQLLRSALIPDSHALGRYALFMTPSEEQIRRALLVMYKRTGVDKTEDLKRLDSDEIWDMMLGPNPKLRDPMLLDDIPVVIVPPNTGGSSGPRALFEQWPSQSAHQLYVQGMHDVSPFQGRAATKEVICDSYSAGSKPDGEPDVYPAVADTCVKLDAVMSEDTARGDSTRAVVWDVDQYAAFCSPEYYGASLSLDGFMMEHMNRLLNSLYTLLPAQQKMAMFLWFMSHRVAETKTVRPSTVLRVGGKFATGKSKVHSVIARWFPKRLFTSCNNETYAAATRDPDQCCLVVMDEAQTFDPQKNPEAYHHALSSVSDGVTRRKFMNRRHNGTMECVDKFTVTQTCRSELSNDKAGAVYASRCLQMLFEEELDRRTGASLLNLGAIAHKPGQAQEAFGNALQWQKCKITEMYALQSVGVVGDPDMTMYRVLMAIAVDRLGGNFLPTRKIEQCALVAHNFAMWRIAMMWELRYKRVHDWKDAKEAQIAFLQTNWIVRGIDAIRAMDIMLLANKTDKHQARVLSALKSSQIMVFNVHTNEPVRNESQQEYYETSLTGSVDRAAAAIEIEMTGGKIGKGNVSRMLSLLMERKHNGSTIVRWIADAKKMQKLCVLADYVDEYISSPEEIVILSALQELAHQSLPPGPDATDSTVHSRWYARPKYPENTVALGPDVCYSGAVVPEWSPAVSVLDVPVVFPHEDAQEKVVIVKLETVAADVSGAVYDLQLCGAVGVIVTCAARTLPQTVDATTYVSDIEIPVMIIPEKSGDVIVAAIDAGKGTEVTMACAQTASEIPGGRSFVYHMAVTSLFQNPTVQQVGLSPLPSSLDDGNGKIKQTPSSIAAGWYFVKKKSFVTTTPTPSSYSAVQLYASEGGDVVGAVPVFPCFSSLVGNSGADTRMGLLQMDSSLLVNYDKLVGVLEATTAVDPPILPENIEVYKLALDIEGYTGREQIIVFNNELSPTTPTSSFLYEPNPDVSITVRNPSRVQRDGRAPTPVNRVAGSAKRRRTSSGPGVGFSAFVRPPAPIARNRVDDSDSSDDEQSEEEEAAPESTTQALADVIFDGKKDTVTFVTGMGPRITETRAMHIYGESPYEGMDIGAQTPLDDPPVIDPRFLANDA